MGEEKKLVFNELILPIDNKVMDNKFLIIDLKGSGVVKVEIYDKIEKKVEKEFGRLISTNPSIIQTSVIEVHFLRHYADKHIKFSFDTMILGE